MDIAEIYYERAVAVSSLPCYTYQKFSFHSFVPVLYILSRKDVLTQLLFQCISLSLTMSQLDETHTNNLCNYGLFLSEEKHAYLKAEELYRLKYSFDKDYIFPLKILMPLQMRALSPHFIAFFTQ